MVHSNMEFSIPHENPNSQLNKLHSELQVINEKSTYKEYFTALALEGLVRSIIENDQSGE